MERKKAAPAAALRPIKTAKTIAKSLPLVAASRDHSTTLKLLLATLRYAQTTLNISCRIKAYAYERSSSLHVE